MRVLSILNYKCFEDQDLQLGDLTILAGANAAGKSSTIQSVLLLKRACDRGTGHKVYLNNLYGLDLGTSYDVLNFHTNKKGFGVSLKDGENEVGVPMLVDNEYANTWLTVKEVMGNGEWLKAKKLYYLSAERIGPRISHRMENLDYYYVGTHGEYTAQVLASDNGMLSIDQSRLYPETVNYKLQFQTNKWLKTIFPDVNVTANTHSETLRAYLKVDNIYSDGNIVKETNIGFGISYVLPVIVNALIAEKDSYFIVENPEAHLHPAAQTAMGQFLAQMAFSGLVIIVETHSEHIINGVQLFVAKHPDWHHNVIINNYDCDKESRKPRVTHIEIGRKGEIKQWPQGFMDQAQVDFIELTNINKNV